MELKTTCCEDYMYGAVDCQIGRYTSERVSVSVRVCKKKLFSVGCWTRGSKVWSIQSIFRLPGSAPVLRQWARPCRAAGKGDPSGPVGLIVIVIAGSIHITVKQSTVRFGECLSQDVFENHYAYCTYNAFYLFLSILYKYL